MLFLAFLICWTKVIGTKFMFLQQAAKCLKIDFRHFVKWAQGWESYDSCSTDKISAVLNYFYIFSEPWCHCGKNMIYIINNIWYTCVIILSSPKPFIIHKQHRPDYLLLAPFVILCVSVMHAVNHVFTSVLWEFIRIRLYWKKWVAYCHFQMKKSETPNDILFNYHKVGLTSN